MKRILVIADGLADICYDELGGLTPCGFARTPALDAMKSKSATGLLQTVSRQTGLGSEAAIMSILGYPGIMTGNGRGGLEAIGSGVAVKRGETAYRCDLMKVGDGADVPASGLTDAEAQEVFSRLDGIFPDIRVSHGLGFRGIAVNASGSPEGMGLFTEVGSRVVADCRVRSVLSCGMGITLSGIRVWGGGTVPRMTPFAERYGLRGAVVAGVDLVKGIGVATGMSVIPVAGATGDCDTDYKGKTAAAIDAINSHDFVLLHIEACDTASHNRDMFGKVRAIEDIDRHILEPLLDFVSRSDEDTAMAFMADHYTLCSTGKHADMPVSFLICHSPEKIDGAGGTVLLEGEGFIRQFIS